MDAKSATYVCIEELEQDKSLWCARIVLDAKTRVKVTARRFNGKRNKKQRDYIVSIGRYDYKDRAHRSDRSWNTVYTQPLPKPRKKRA